MLPKKCCYGASANRSLFGSGTILLREDWSRAFYFATITNRVKRFVSDKGHIAARSLGIASETLQCALFQIPEGLGCAKERHGHGLELFGRIAVNTRAIFPVDRNNNLVMGHLGSQCAGINLPITR